LSLPAPAPTGGPGVLASSLTDVYTAIATAAPRAKILVTGYPYLFNPPTPCTPTSVEIVCQINYATTLLNQTIATTVAAMPDSVDIEYVDVTVAFARHGIGGDLELFINASGPHAYHPNVAGYRAYARKLIDALRPAGLARAS
jgi:lysophospholipase L1-like esterase